MNIIARTCMGAIDLYNGCPDLIDAKVVDIKYIRESDHMTELTLQTKNGLEYKITIAEALY